MVLVLPFGGEDVGIVVSPVVDKIAKLEDTVSELSAAVNDL